MSGPGENLAETARWERDKLTAPLTTDEFADLQAAHDDQRAKKRKARSERDAAYSVIRRYEDGWANFGHECRSWHRADAFFLQPMTDLEIKAIRRATEDGGGS